MSEKEVLRKILNLSNESNRSSKLHDEAFIYMLIVLGLLHCVLVVADILEVHPASIFRPKVCQLEKIPWMAKRISIFTYSFYIHAFFKFHKFKDCYWWLQPGPLVLLEVWTLMITTLDEIFIVSNAVMVKHRADTKFTNFNIT
jgi:hypothetical protein